MAGHMEHRGGDKWRLSVFVGRDADGKQIRKRKTFVGTDRQAEKELARFLTEVEKGQALGATKYTLESFVEIWLHDYAEKNLAPKTLFRYKEMLTTRIIPALGHIKIEKIRPVHVLEFHNAMQESGAKLSGKYIALPSLAPLLSQYRTYKLKAQAAGVPESTIRWILSGKTTTRAEEISAALGVKLDSIFKQQEQAHKPLSPMTILHHHRLLSTILNHAVQWQIIADNPAARVKPPKVKKTRVACYDEAQTMALLDALDREPEESYSFKVIIALAIHTGLRRGELMGLEWCDVNSEQSTIEVRQSSQYVPSEGVITKEPKNETSERLVSVPAPVIALLRNYKTHQNAQQLKVGNKWQDSKRLFTTWDGQPMHPDTISKWLPDFLKRHDLPHITLHGLRHTSATLLIGQGVHAKTISTRLGHSNISTTMDIYGHALKSADKGAADKLDNLFGSRGTNGGTTAQKVPQNGLTTPNA